MFSSKVNQIDINDLADKVVELYHKCLRKIQNSVTRGKDDDEDVIEFICRLSSPGHLNRREVQSLKSLIHAEIPICGNIWANQSRMDGKWQIEIAIEFCPDYVQRVWLSLAPMYWPKTCRVYVSM